MSTSADDVRYLIMGFSSLEHLCRSFHCFSQISSLTTVWKKLLESGGKGILQIQGLQPNTWIKSNACYVALLTLQIAKIS